VLGALRAALPPSLYAAMSNDASGAPLFALLTFGNFGEARDRGLELGLTAWLRPEWRAEAAYTWMDFTVESQAVESVITPNSPPHQFSAGTMYGGSRVSASVKVRAVRAFSWSAGIYAGPVPAYAVVDAGGGYQVHTGWRVEVDAANLLDRRHYEAFGGSVLGRRLLASLVRVW